MQKGINLHSQPASRLWISFIDIFSLEMMASSALEDDKVRGAWKWNEIL